MTTTLDHIQTAMNNIFQDRVLLNVANKQYNQYSGDLTTLYSKLSELCGCNFQAAAGLNIDSTQLSSNAGITGSQIAEATIDGSNIKSETIDGSNIKTGTIISANILDSTIATIDIANNAITTAKQGFGIWNSLTATGTWSTNTFITSGTPITNCGTQSTAFKTLVASAPTAGDHVEFQDFLAIVGECGKTCTANSDVPGCVSTFFTFV